MRRGSLLPLWCLAVLAGQGFHVLEHVLQVYQAYAIDAAHAHGLLGKYFDTDVLHLVFNAAFLAAIMPAALAGGNLRDLRWQLFLGGLWAASYHVVEHSVKAWQFLVMGQFPAQGIIGVWGPLIPIHAWLNLTVYALVVPHLLAVGLGWNAPGSRRATAVPAP